MIIDVTVQYEAMVRKRRKRDFECVTYSCVVPVDVAEYASVDAPIAASYEAPRDLYAPEHGSVDVTLRDVEGRLAAPVVARDADNETLDVACDVGWLRRVATGQPGFGYDPFHVLRPVSRPVPTIQDDPPAAIERNDESLRGQEARALAADLAFVDGLLWRVTPEPVLYVGRPRIPNGTLKTGYVYPRSALDQFKVRPSDVWRLDQADAALTHDSERATLSGRPVKLPRIEVLRPGLFHHGATELAMEFIARGAMGHMASGLVDRDLPFMAAYVELRDALAAIEPSRPSLADAGRLASALEIARGRIAAVDHHQSYQLTEIDDALRRWHMQSPEPEDLSSFTP